MPDFTVIIKAEYRINAKSPKEAIERAFERSNHPDKLGAWTAGDPAVAATEALDELRAQLAGE